MWLLERILIVLVMLISSGVARADQSDSIMFTLADGTVLGPYMLAEFGEGRREPPFVQIFIGVTGPVNGGPFFAGVNFMNAPDMPNMVSDTLSVNAVEERPHGVGTGLYDVTIVFTSQDGLAPIGHVPGVDRADVLETEGEVKIDQDLLPVLGPLENLPGISACSDPDPDPKNGASRPCSCCAVVPEPSTLPLFLPALATIGWMARLQWWSNSR